MNLPEPPPGWGADTITDFIDNTRQNCFGVYDKFRQEYAKLLEVDTLFRDAIERLNNTNDWFAALFLVRSHSAFRAGVHLAMAGQAAEVCAPLRLCIENALYGLYFTQNPASAEVWLRRNDGAEAKRRVKKEFTTRNLFDTLRGVDRSEAEFAEQLYESCIDFGAHPNQLAFAQNLRLEDGPGEVDCRSIYLTDDCLVYRFCLTTVARVGTSVLGVFRLAFRERFDITGLSEQLEQARQGL